MIFLFLFQQIKIDYHLLVLLIIMRNHLNSMNDPKIISIYFGVPGSGKSTFAASIAHRCLKHHYPVYSNFPIVGCFKYVSSDLGKKQIENCKMILDEAGIEFNNRAFKSFSQDQLQFFKLHRHYNVSIDVFSQTYDDMDKKIRDLAQRLYIVRKSFIPYFVVCIPIRKKIDIDNNTHQIIDGYYFDHPLIRIFTSKRCFMPKYWKYFNSYSAPELDHFDFIKYEKR